MTAATDHKTDGTADASPVLAAVLVAIVALAAFSFAFTPLRSSQDEWWHLKAGRWIVENRRLPVFDIFTYTGENTPWHNHEWLSQVILYGVYAAGEDRAIGGVRALVLFKAVIVAATFAFVTFTAFRRSGSWTAAGLVGLVAAEISRRTIYPRPPIFSYLLFTVFLFALAEWKSGRLRGRWLWLLVPLMVLWANLHGMCLLGIVAAAGFAGGEMLEGLAKWLGGRRHGGDGPKLIRCVATRPVALLGGLTAALVVGAMASPSGWEIFFLGGKFKNDPILKQVIAEMLPTPFFLRQVPLDDGSSRLVFVPGYAAFWVALAAFGLLLACNRGRLPWGADYLLSGFFAWQAVMHWRLLPLFAIAAAGPLAWLLSRSHRPGARLSQAAAVPVLAALFVFAVGEPPPQTFFRRNLQVLRGEVMDPVSYPEPLMKFIIRADLPGRMFSEINYCGYAIWWLSPEHHKLFTDNRFDVWGSRYFVEHEVVRNGVDAHSSVLGRGWSDILDEYGVNFIVLSRDAPLNERLTPGSGWLRVASYPPHGEGKQPWYHVYLRDVPEFAETAARARHLAETGMMP